MDGHPPRRPSATPEGQNPEGRNPGNNARGSNVPDPEVPQRTGKEPMQPEDPANQDYTEGGDDEEYYEDDYYPPIVEEENEILRQRLAESNRANEELARLLEESQRGQPRRPKKKYSRRTQAALTETATVQSEAQARTGPVTRQAARASGGTQTQTANVLVPQGPMKPPSHIQAPPSPIRHPEQPRNNIAPPNNNSRGSRGNRASNQNQGAKVSERPGSNQQNKPAAHPLQPRQHNVPQLRMRNEGLRPIPRTTREHGPGHILIARPVLDLASRLVRFLAIMRDVLATSLIFGNNLTRTED